MKEKISGIYKITSPTNCIYIGQSRDCYRRWQRYKHKEYQKQIRLRRSMEKHGVENHKFEILHRCPESELDFWENFYIGLFGTFETRHGLNLVKGSAATGKRSQETRQRNSVATKKLYESGLKQRPIGEKNPMFGNGHKLAGEKNGRFGMKVSQQTRNKISESNKTFNKTNGVRKLTDEIKAKISLSKTGKPNGHLGMKRSEETRKRMSEARRLLIASGYKHKVK